MQQTKKSNKSNRSILFLAIASTLFMILYAQFVLGHFSKCFEVENALNSLGLSFGYSSEVFLNFIHARSNNQLECYISFIKIWDTLFPILYTAMYISWFVYFFKSKYYLLLVPISHMIADWIENLMEISAITEYMLTQSLNSNLVSIGSTISIIKWSLSMTTYLIILYGIFSKLIPLIKKRSPH